MPDFEQRAAFLRSHAVAFCNAFVQHGSSQPHIVLDKHFALESPRITEHGPDWATRCLPFLGKQFKGRRSGSGAKGSSCEDYFELLSQTLSVESKQSPFPGPDDFIVDSGAGAKKDGKAGMVSVVGHAKFASVRTGKAWEEDFVYRLSEFDDEGRIGHWEIWADPLSAYMAVGAD